MARFKASGGHLKRDDDILDSESDSGHTEDYASQSENYSNPDWYIYSDDNSDDSEGNSSDSDDGDDEFENDECRTPPDVISGQSVWSWVKLKLKKQNVCPHRGPYCLSSALSD
ncbi:hypothetical protein BV25DRAFT_1826865 [Artomyces pyxidatus]|uniref:Uncharacterized protein n=1 Tax=Artomyces pyxidatus TaxID=48021 RepID=A0ACB8SYW4_9AGAM|nr:hypothetical protein BV25DRAFT_1826865 [Artomyces pyxidatus]